jgi:hypothetical protein
MAHMGEVGLDGTQRVGRMSWTDAHRLEATLRARASRLGMVRLDRSKCAGCGEPVALGDHMRLGGVPIHPGCLELCRDDPSAA